MGGGAARVTEARSPKMSDTERHLAQAKDVLMGVALVTGIATGVAGVRLAAQASEGAVPEETGTVPVSKLRRPRRGCNAPSARCRRSTSSPGLPSWPSTE